MRVPKHTQSSFILGNFCQRFNGVVHSQILMIFAENLDESPSSFFKQNKIFNQIQQTTFLANSLDDGVQTHNSFFTFRIDSLPLRKMLKLACDCSNATFSTIAQNDKSVVPKKLRNRFFVVPEIIFKSIFDIFVCRFEFDENQWQAVHKPNQIGSAFVHFSRDPKLRHQQEIILFNVFKINDLDPHIHHLAVFIGN